LCGIERILLQGKRKEGSKHTPALQLKERTIMADNNLDDFFAKRDKKKKTGKNKKFDTADDLAKILGKRVEDRKKLEEGKSQYVPEEGQAAVVVS
jgi:hypothetical protein